MILDHLVKNLAPFVVDPPLLMPGKIKFVFGSDPAPYYRTHIAGEISGVKFLDEDGNHTRFTVDFSVGDILGVWYPSYVLPSANNSKRLIGLYKIAYIEDDYNMEIDSTVVYSKETPFFPIFDTGQGMMGTFTPIHYCKVINLPLGQYLLTCAHELEDLFANLPENYDNSREGLVRRCQQNGLLCGNWESDEELRCYLAMKWIIHHRRGTRGLSTDEISGLTWDTDSGSPTPHPHPIAPYLYDASDVSYIQSHDYDGRDSGAARVDLLTPPPDNWTGEMRWAGIMGEIRRLCNWPNGGNVQLYDQYIDWAIDRRVDRVTGNAVDGTYPDVDYNADYGDRYPHAVPPGVDVPHQGEIIPDVYPGGSFPVSPNEPSGPTPSNNDEDGNSDPQSPWPTGDYDPLSPSPATGPMDVFDANNPNRNSDIPPPLGYPTGETDTLESGLAWVDLDNSLVIEIHNENPSITDIQMRYLITEYLLPYGFAARIIFV